LLSIPPRRFAPINIDVLPITYPVALLDFEDTGRSLWKGKLACR
jgi:hypothetical protein